MESDRLPSFEEVQNYLAARRRGSFDLAGEPKLTFTVDPLQSRFAIRIRSIDAEPNTDGYRYVGFETILEGVDVVNQLSIDIPRGGEEEAYGWLQSVIHRIQVGGEPFSVAVNSSLRSVDDLFSVESRLSFERQVGLLGELIAFKSIATELGSELAIDAWLGVASEEHDFRLEQLDLEVKTTTTEHRHHWISSSTQLVPQQSRPLYLLSIQLTAATSTVGCTLSEFAKGLEQLLDDETQRARYRAHLENAGLEVAKPYLYPRSWSLRTPPAFFAVDKDFPSLVSEDVAQLIATPSQLLDFNYRVDLSGLPEIALAFEFTPLDKD